jgi:glycosyltransferase involved in cell wall biosynthesis
MAKKRTKMINRIVMFFDHIIFPFVLAFFIVGLIFAIPWILKQRREWKYSAKGNGKVLILRGFTVEKVMKRGSEYLLPYRNPSIKWTGFLDPANSRKTSVKITDDLYLIAWQSPKLVNILEKAGFFGTSIIFRELIAVFRVTNFCIKERIGLIRAYDFIYSGLQAYLVSSFIKIPYVVDVAGNLELIYRLNGKAYYFKTLNRTPIIRIFARAAMNWLLGLPLRHASRVFGRNKNNYEHAFALGAPIDRLSLLRISNFNAVFNNYNPEKAPAKPAEYSYILFVGRLAKINFPLDVIDAFNIVAAKLPQHRLIIIGDGPIREKIEQGRLRSEFKDRIILLGACSSNTVFNWTAHAKVAICPFSGSTLAEAMLCGIPVIAYDVEWHAEVIIEDYTGYLVPFRDVKAMAEKIIYVLQNYDDARIVSKRGRELARVVFDKDKIREKESIYYKQAFTA